MTNKITSRWAYEAVVDIREDSTPELNRQYRFFIFNASSENRIDFRNQSLSLAMGIDFETRISTEQKKADIPMTGGIVSFYLGGGVYCCVRGNTVFFLKSFKEEGVPRKAELVKVSVEAMALATIVFTLVDDHIKSIKSAH